MCVSCKMAKAVTYAAMPPVGRPEARQCALRSRMLVQARQADRHSRVHSRPLLFPWPIYIHTHTHMYICMYMYVHLNIYICIYTHIYACILVYILGYTVLAVDVCLLASFDVCLLASFDVCLLASCNTLQHTRFLQGAPDGIADIMSS